MPTPLELIDANQRRLNAADLYYGHGTDNAADDALFLVLHGLGLGYDASDEVLNTQCSDAATAKVQVLIDRRINERLPSAYLTNRMWFAGLEFYVDERVLIPRSPLAELISSQFSPWTDQLKVRRILEIGTGSGCIAIALAQYFPESEVVATDISPAALDVAARNLAGYQGLSKRLSFVEADLFPAENGSFDLIVTNPPYVPDGYMADLPAEYHAEPALALRAGDDGLRFVREIFAKAADRLNPGGLLFFDVGDRWSLMEQTFPETPFTWFELSRGGEGIGMLDKTALGRLAQTQVK